MTPDSPFIESLLGELRVADDPKRQAFLNVQHAWGTLHAAVDGMHDYCSRPAQKRDWQAIRAVLLEISRTACLAAKDFGIESMEEAIEKTIPF